MKTILMIALAAILGGGILWVAPHRLFAADTAPAGRKILYYTCPMHPSVKANKSGDCPVCGMSLVPVYDTGNRAGTNTPPSAVGTNTSPTKLPACCGSGGCH